MANGRTEGERLFEQYLDEMRYAYEFEKEYEGKKKRPDYTVTIDGAVVLFDAKDFSPMMPLGFNQFDPYFRVRQRIDDGRQKFREFKEFPCCIVLRNNGNVFVDLESPGIVLGAMYGDSGFKVPVYLGPGKSHLPPPPPHHAFLGGGKMISGNRIQNTTISALVSLRNVAVGMSRLRKIYRNFPHFSVAESMEVACGKFPNFDVDERRLGVIVWENAVARIPLPRNLFTGPYDLRWGVEGVDQTIVFEGEGLRDLVADQV